LLNTAKYHSGENSSRVCATAHKAPPLELLLSQLDQFLTGIGISVAPVDNAPGVDIHSAFPDVSICRHTDTAAMFQGRNLPSYVKDYILRRYSDSKGKVDVSRLKEYLEAKMPADSDSIKNRILRGEQINVTARVVFKPDLAGGRITFELPDLGIISDAKVARTLMEEKDDVFFDGEQWGNLTMRYVEPEKRQKGFVEMISYKPFQPYTVDLNFFRKARRGFSLEQWIDALVGIMGYDASKLENEEVKLEYISRLLPFVEPFLNMIELGPKSTGKSHLYNNLSKRGWCISGGKITRAKLFYNKSNHKFGLLKHYDVVSIDEISTFIFGDSDEMQSAFKSYLEAGKCTIDNTTFLSDCGLVLMGNIPLDENKQPLDSEFYKVLPVTLRESATLDRFHGFI
ncbi:MAG: BREX system Lon protease-like protein BrxL, partial [Muribaculaceae bacterium]|nr:BREX system Lon protease-like protein BrxL [Muribaculaceae bacterium]